jgi:hypothetical protein
MRLDLLLRLEHILLATDIPQLLKEKVTSHTIILCSTEGFSVEFATLNPMGFLFYSLYTVAGFIDRDIGAGNVATNDLFFALHAFMASAIQLTHIFVYGNVSCMN